jgi:hypothetical protein
VVSLPETPDEALTALAETWKRERPYSPKKR